MAIIYCMLTHARTILHVFQGLSPHNKTLSSISILLQLPCCHPANRWWNFNLDPPWAFSSLGLHRGVHSYKWGWSGQQRDSEEADLQQRSTAQSPLRVHRPWLWRNPYPKYCGLSLKSHQITRYILSRGSKIQLNRNFH